MKTILTLLVLSGASGAPDNSALPPEVASYIEDRDLCEHFAQEPLEGKSPEQVERREFLRQSIEIHCAGTDRRLAALKERYMDNTVVLARLQDYEVSSEGSCK